MDYRIDSRALAKLLRSSAESSGKLNAIIYNLEALSKYLGSVERMYSSKFF